MSQPQPPTPPPPSGGAVTASAPTQPSSSTTPAPPSSATTAAPKPPPRPVPAFLRPLQFMGVPRSLLSAKPRLPSRKWSIFLITVGTLSYLYYDDRKQCKRIRQHYIDQVSHLAQQPMKPNEWPRKVVVYTTKSPGDDDYDQALRYFKKYVKPILTAAAVDWEVTNGTRHGGLARELQARFMERRRKLLGLEPWDASTSDPNMPHSPFALSPQQQLQREIDGGIVLVGRPALKEWAWALKHGWSATLEVVKRDREQEIAAELAEDHVFDEVPDVPTDAEGQGSAAATAAAATTATTGVKLEEMSEQERAIAALAEGGEEDGAGAPLPSSRFASGGNPAYNPRGGTGFASMFQPRPSPGASSSSSTTTTTAEKPQTEAEKLAAKLDPRLLAAPDRIPAQPPVSFVDFTNLVGWRNIPLRIVNFFRVRDKVRAGAEVGLSIVYGTKESAREFDTAASTTTMSGEGEGEGGVRSTPPQGGDLDWGLESETRYAPYFLKTPSNISSAREAFYKSLPQHLKDARDLARGLREPSRLEKNDPPKTEAELREQRLKNEIKWRNNLMGFEVIRPEKGVEWDESWRGSLRVFEIGEGRRREVEEEGRRWRDEAASRSSSSSGGATRGRGGEEEVVTPFETTGEAEELRGSRAWERIEEAAGKKNGWRSWF